MVLNALPASISFKDAGHHASPANGNKFVNTIHRPTNTANCKATYVQYPKNLTSLNESPFSVSHAAYHRTRGNLSPVLPL